MGKSKKILIQTLDKICNGHSTLLNQYKLNIDFDIDAVFMVTITNITKLVLDESYFEKISLLFTIDPQSKKIECQYGCKYSAGNLWSLMILDMPMLPEKFPQAVEDFETS